MTPKEKAEQLVKRYACLNRGEYVNDWIDRDIIFDFVDLSCALIAVDEILNNDNNFFNTYSQNDYWLEVKQEIDKL